MSVVEGHSKGVVAVRSVQQQGREGHSVADDLDIGSSSDRMDMAAVESAVEEEVDSREVAAELGAVEALAEAAAG